MYSCVAVACAVHNLVQYLSSSCRQSVCPYASSSTMKSKTIAALTIGSSIIDFSAAVKIFSNATIPANLTTDCSSALLADIACSPVVASFRNGYYYPAATLNATCTSACEAALTSYELTIDSSCNNQVWQGYSDEDMPVLVIPNLLKYQYDLTCLQDSGRWCNVVAGSAAQAADPGGR